MRGVWLGLLLLLTVTGIPVSAETLTGWAISVHIKV